MTTFNWGGQCDEIMPPLWGLGFSAGVVFYKRVAPLALGMGPRPSLILNP